MRHRGEAVLAEGEPLHLGVGRMLFDVLRVLARASARMQHGRVAVGQSREFVEPSAGQGAEPVEMGCQMCGEIARQIECRQTGEIRVGTV